MIVADDVSLGRRPDIYGPSGGGDMFGLGRRPDIYGPQGGGEMFGAPPEGNVLKSRAEDTPSDVFGMGTLALEAHIPLLVASIAAFAGGSALMIFGEKPGLIYLGDTLSFLGLVGALVSVRMINR